MADSCTVLIAADDLLPALKARALDDDGELLAFSDTRRSTRYPIAGAVEVIVDGNTAALVDLSTIGAHVLSATILKPNQRVRMTVADDQITIRMNAVVAWAFFEIPPKIGPRYRAGIEFLDANAADVGAYRLRRS